MKRKNERLASLEKAYLEIKESNDIFKSKYETLKKIVNQNELASRIFSLTNPFPSKSINLVSGSNDLKEKEENKQEVLISRSSIPNLPSTKNIVKPIKGGHHGK